MAKPLMKLETDKQNVIYNVLGKLPSHESKIRVLEHLLAAIREEATTSYLARSLGGQVGQVGQLGLQTQSKQDALPFGDPQ